MKIALVANWDWVLYNFHLTLAKALKKTGCEVVLICPAGAYTSKLQALGFRVLDWRVRRRSLSPLKESVAIAHLAYLYLRERPDIVHHFTIKPNLYGSIAALIARAPRVLNTFMGLGFAFSPAFKARLIRTVVVPAFRLVNCRHNIVTTFENPLDRLLFLKLGIVGIENSSVITQYVNTHFFIPRSIGGSAHKAPVVLMAARLLVDKGVREFVEAAELLQKTRTGALFWIAGAPDSGNPSCISNVELNQLKDKGIVKFLGNRDDMPTLLRQADIAVLPSYYYEGTPRFLLEAAATGLPLVTTNIEGCRMVVRDGVNGFLVPPKDAKTLAQSIAKLLDDAELRERMGRASREIAVQQFDEALVIEQYLRVYSQLGLMFDQQSFPAAFTAKKR